MRLRVNDDLVCLSMVATPVWPCMTPLLMAIIGQFNVGAIGQTNAVLAISRVIVEKVAQLLCFYLK
ncbi:hypothetical protein [Candidatus Nitrotoga sp. M5]|uniref:hypothetical protein n=1 Tax=Candidatus Nitrotoga sp. M5 TaxID=2890409 RepID=UPI001EF4483E|nr:hypothetical protein [Candidatus Nitrotoga sp. M5]